MAETTSLLNWRAGLPYRGFESPSFRAWRFHLMVRIHASHAWYTGSIPVGATITKSSIAISKTFFVILPLRTYLFKVMFKKTSAILLFLFISSSSHCFMRQSNPERGYLWKFKNNNLWTFMSHWWTFMTKRKKVLHCLIFNRL